MRRHGDREPRAAAVAINLGGRHQRRHCDAGQAAEPREGLRQDGAFQIKLGRRARVLELAAAAPAVDRARRRDAVRRRRHDFEEPRLAVSLLDASRLHAHLLARQHALDENGQSPVMREALAALDELLDLNQDALVLLSRLRSHRGAV